MNEQQALARHRARVYRFLLFLTQNREVSQELTQETFKVALSRGTDPAKGIDYGGWLLTIAKNLLRNYQRKAQSHWLAFTDGLLEVAERRFIAGGAEDDGLWEARQRALLSCLQRLSEANRRLILLRYRVGEKVQKMASDMGLAPNALSKRLERIREALRDCINSIVRGKSNE